MMGPCPIIALLEIIPNLCIQAAFNPDTTRQWRVSLSRILDAKQADSYQYGRSAGSGRTNSFRKSRPPDILVITIPHDSDMNWLAHIVLSESHIEFQHGNLLADLLKGRCWPHASAQFKAGLQMHRFIDRFTDTHPLVRQSKHRLAKSGRLRGVVIDVAYDHLLAKNWSRFATPNYTNFVEAFHHASRQVSGQYTGEAQRFLTRLIDTGHLHDYASLSGVKKALWRIEQRLSSRVLAKERPLDYLPSVSRELEKIEADFLDFMPQLIHHFKTQAAPIAPNHWLK